MNYTVLAEVLTAIFAILATYAGAKLGKVKRVLKDLSNAMEDTCKAIDDNRITPEELKRVIQDWKRVVDDLK